MEKQERKPIERPLEIARKPKNLAGEKHAKLIRSGAGKFSDQWGKAPLPYTKMLPGRYGEDCIYGVFSPGKSEDMARVLLFGTGSGTSRGMDLLGRL